LWCLLATDIWNRTNVLTGPAFYGDFVALSAGGGLAIAGGRSVLAIAGQRISIDGPHGTRILGIRFDKYPIFRIDYGPYPGTKNQPRLHFHIWPDVDEHYPIDPRRWFD
jgi:hypothetical protein